MENREQPEKRGWDLSDLSDYEKKELKSMCEAMRTAPYLSSRQYDAAEEAIRRFIAKKNSECGETDWDVSSILSLM